MNEATTKGSMARNLVALAFRDMLRYRDEWSKAADEYDNDPEDEVLELNYFDTWERYITSGNMAYRLKQKLFGLPLEY